jgi:hypothetical protein
MDDLLRYYFQHLMNADCLIGSLVQSTLIIPNKFARTVTFLTSIQGFSGSNLCASIDGPDGGLPLLSLVPPYKCLDKNFQLGNNASYQMLTNSLSLSCDHSILCSLAGGKIRYRMKYASDTAHYTYGVNLERRMLITFCM